MKRINRIMALLVAMVMSLMLSINVYADEKIVPELLTQKEISNSLQDVPKDMKLVGTSQMDLDENTYIETESYEAEINGLTRAGAKTKIGTYTYRVKDKKTQVALIKYVLTGKFTYNGRSCKCTESIGVTTHLVRNRFLVLNDRSEKSGDTAIGYFYCRDKKNNNKMFGGTFKIRINKNGKITFP